MKKRYLLTILFACLLTIATAQKPNWQWANSINGTGADYGFANNLATDAAGNTFVTGYYESDTMTTGADVLFNSHITSEVFVIKNNAQGHTLWARSSKCKQGTLFANSIATDGNGGAVFTGTFTDTTTLGNIILAPVPHATSSLFLVKYDADGNVLWAKSPRTGHNTGDMGGVNVATDGSGNILLAGYFGSDSILLGDTVLEVINGSGFIAKYSPDGNILWAKNEVIGQDMATDTAGNIYITGTFSFPSLTIQTQTLFNSGIATTDAFVVKYDTLGNVIWCRTLNGTGDENSRSIHTDATGNVFITGDFFGADIVFGNSTMRANLLAPAYFVAKFGPTGMPLWAKTAIADGSCYGMSVTTDTSGNCYATGAFESVTALFGSDTLTGTGAQTIFVVKYDTSGNQQWSTNTINDGAVFGSGIGTDANGGCYVALNYGDFDFPLGNIILRNKGTWDMAVAKIEDVSTGIKNIATAAGIGIFPNPSMGQFYFTNVSVGSQIEIYNVLGDRVYSAIATGQSTAINLTGAAKGVYFYRITSKSNAILPGRLVIE